MMRSQGRTIVVRSDLDGHPDVAIGGHVRGVPLNPILARFRKYAEGEPPCEVANEYLFAVYAWRRFGGFIAWEHVGHPYHPFTTASEAEIEFAHKVLTRLAALG